MKLQVLSAQDYYPFGSLMPGRSFNANGYRFGFNGQEMDNEVFKNPSTSYTAEFWQYDSRIGRRWNLDPNPQISISDYAAFGDNPIYNVDHKGDEFDPASQEVVDNHKNETTYLLQGNEVKQQILNKQLKGAGNTSAYVTIARQLNTVTEAVTEFKSALTEIKSLETSPQLYSLHYFFGVNNSNFKGQVYHKNGVIHADYTDNSSLAHELKHLSQFENKELSFATNEDKGGYLYDANDEIEAYRRQSFYNGNIALRNMNADEIRNYHDNYKTLRNGPFGAESLIKDVFSGDVYLKNKSNNFINRTFGDWNQEFLQDIIKH